MKKILFMAALFCLLASANHVNGQLIIRNNGHAEIGTNPNMNDADYATVLKIFGDEPNSGAGSKITFGDSTYVSIGELGTTNSNRLWIHGKEGLYFTSKTLIGPVDTIAYFDRSRSDAIHFNYDVTTTGVFLQSDERFKDEIEPISNALQNLQNLEPVSYKLKRYSNYASLDTISKICSDDISFQKSLNNNQINSERYGFIAQNVKDVYPQLVHSDDDGFLTVDYIGLIPILVQSINELQNELAQLKADKDAEICDSHLFQVIGTSSKDEIESTTGEFRLYQNAPNPWNSETEIRYLLPHSVKEAEIFIYDMQGVQLKRIPAQGRGENQVILNANDLKAGLYIYCLIADGALIDSKKMILTK